MRIDNNQVIDSYGADTLQPTNERQLGVIPRRRHEWRIMASSALLFSQLYSW
jgi:hypothetical protein